MTEETTQSTPQSFFERNLKAWRDFIAKKGAYFDANGWLCYKGKKLTRYDTEYIDFTDNIYKRLLTEKELEESWIFLLLLTRAEVDDA